MQRYCQLIRHNGNKSLFRVVEMAAIAVANDHPFHIQTEGLRGTGKTTIMRAAREIMPPIERIKGCIYNCHPQKPHCPHHRKLSSCEIALIGTEFVPRPFLEISQSAKMGTIVGSIDLAKLTDPENPSAALLPGSIPQAHRGIIFIDEINRLADTAPEIADILLDVMGTKPGRIQIEEPGLPLVELPVSVCIWAASNPDEDPGPLGQVRRQLADRFDLTVKMGRPNEVDDLLAIMGEANDAAALAELRSFGDLAEVKLSEPVKSKLAQIYIKFELESLRCVEAMATATRLTAMHNGRQIADLADLVEIIPLALAHRVDTATIGAIKEFLMYNELEDVSSSSNVKDQGQGFVSESCLAKWWRHLKSCLSSAIDQGQSGFLSGSGSKKTVRVIDPSKTSIKAPPHPAVPLTKLPEQRMVTREPKQNG